MEVIKKVFIAFLSMLPVLVRCQDIQKIVFFPIDFTASQNVNIEVYLTGLATGPTNLQIQLITWTDLNRDCKLENNERSVKTFSVVDNDRLDLNPARNVIRLKVATVPVSDQPVKYTAVVTCGKNTKSLSVNPSNAFSGCNIPDLQGRGVSLLSRLSGAIRNVFDNIDNSLRGNTSSHGPGKDTYAIGLYDTKADSVERYVSIKDAVQMPVLMPDNKSITFFTKIDAKQYLYSYDLDKATITCLDSGRFNGPVFPFKGTSSFLYVKDNKLRLFDCSSLNSRVIVDSLFFENILFAQSGNQGDEEIFYTSKDPNVTSNYEVNLLTVSADFKKMGNDMLVNNPYWFCQRYQSPKTGLYVVSKDTLSNKMLALVEIKDATSKLKKLLVTGDYDAYQPCWSEDGRYIVFTCTKPKDL